MVHRTGLNGVADVVEPEEQELHLEVGSDRPRVVVVGLDATQLSNPHARSSLHAAAYAAGLARREGAQLVAVWVRPRLAMVDRFAETVETIVEERADREAEVRQLVEEAAGHFGIPSASLVVVDGNPYDELTSTAAQVGADLVVVGASEQRVGSLAARLIRDGRWPVTVVP